MSVDPVADHLRALEVRRLSAVVAPDHQVLDTLHAAGFSLCTPSGDVWDRAHHLDGLLDGSIDYRRFEATTPVEVVADRDLAVLRHRSEIEVSIGGGSPGRLRCWHLDVYQREASGWRCRWSQATDTIRD